MRSRSGPASWMTGPVRAPATDVTDLPRGTSRGRPPCAWRAPPAPRSTLVSGSGSGAKAATAARPDHRHRLGRRPKRPPSTSPTCSPPTAAAPCSATWAPCSRGAPSSAASAAGRGHHRARVPLPCASSSAQALATDGAASPSCSRPADRSRPPLPASTCAAGSI